VRDSRAWDPADVIDYSGLIFAALMIGHHFAISAL
jgi:hypothetical protein